MRLIWALAGKDLLQTRRDRLAPIFSVIMPIAFTAFFGLLFGGNGVNNVPLDVLVHDKGAQAQQLVTTLSQSKVLKVTVRTDDAAAEKRVVDQKTAAELIVPDGYSAAVAGGKQATLTIVSEPGSSGAQSVAAEVRRVAGRQIVAEQAARAAAMATTPTSSLSAARGAVAGALATPALNVSTVSAGSKAGKIPAGFVLSSPGMLLNFILFSLVGAGAALILERRSGTLRRLLTTRLRRGQLILGKYLGMFILTFAQQIIMILVGQLAFGVDYFRDPLALVLVMLSLSALVSSLGMLLAVLFDSEQALIASTVMVSMGVTALSGGWFPLEITGSAFSAIGHALPTAWILDAYRGIILRGWGVTQVLPAVGFALGVAVVVFALSSWRFRRAT
jgi:ABC-2 type transport system permease protein